VKVLMAISVCHSYSCSTDEFFKVLCTQDYIEQKYLVTGGQKIKFLEFEKNGTHFINKSEREVTVDVPKFATKILSPVSQIAQIDSWILDEKEIKEGSFSLEINRKPIQINGKLKLVPTAQGCDYHIDIEVKVKILLIGKKIAGVIEKDTLKDLEIEYSFTKKYLEEM
jgi:hypothetical protein